MASIDEDTVKIIVENSLRKNGFSGIVNGVNLEQAWKASIPQPNGSSVELTLNLQNMRDAMAQAIVDALTATSATGSISEGNNTTSNQNVSQSVDLHINGDVTAPAAARVGDLVKIDLTDPLNASLATWGTNVSTATDITNLTPGVNVALWTAIQAVGIWAEVNTGSNTVNIGD